MPAWELLTVESSRHSIKYTADIWTLQEHYQTFGWDVKLKFWPSEIRKDPETWFCCVLLVVVGLFVFVCVWGDVRWGCLFFLFVCFRRRGNHIGRCIHQAQFTWQNTTATLKCHSHPSLLSSTRIYKFLPFEIERGLC